MSENNHERAVQLIFRSLAESVTESDSKWLENHLTSCRECAGQAAAAGRAVQAIRSVSVRVDPELVELTRLRVRRRAQQLGSRRLPGVWFWAVSALSWVWIVASASYLWRGFGWMAHKAGIPSPIWQMGFALWWSLPALILAAVLSVEILQDAIQMKD